MLFGEKMTNINDGDFKHFPEDMSQTGLLILTKTLLDFKLEVIPGKDSLSGVIEFCNNGTRYRDRKIHMLLISLATLLALLEENDEAKRIKIKHDGDGDIRVFITQDVKHKLPDIDFSQKFTFIRTLSKYSEIVLTLDNFFYFTFTFHSPLRRLRSLRFLELSLLGGLC